MKKYIIWVWPKGTNQALNESPLSWTCSENEQTKVRQFVNSKGFNCRFVEDLPVTAEGLANMFRQTVK